MDSLFLATVVLLATASLCQSMILMMSNVFHSVLWPLRQKVVSCTTVQERQ